jgi:hypothetical protein
MKKALISLGAGGAWGYGVDLTWRAGYLPVPYWIMMVLFVCIPACILGALIGKYVH